jgi:uncharacterized C2H2 Zn-finger protein
MDNAEITLEASRFIRCELDGRILREDTMEMGSKKEIGKIEAQGEVYKCPSCGYEDGFHVSFRWKEKGTDGEVYLICPRCQSRFRVGWKISGAVTV